MYVTNTCIVLKPSASGCLPVSCRGTRDHAGSDVECSSNQALYAPFDGYILWSVPPYGDGSCCDDGFDFVSTDPDWPGDAD